jgi:ketopantoate hydroxymethyltransferase
MGKPYEGPLPRHAKRYTNIFEEAKSGFAAFKAEVESGAFPSSDHTIRADPAVVDAFRAALNDRSK